MSSRRPLSGRIYRGAMWLVFPRAFRERFGNEMTDFALARIDAARERGSTAVAREWLALGADLLRTAPTAWAVLRTEQLRQVAPRHVFYPRDNMDILFQDLRYALRSLAKRPAFTAVAAITLALGIGANTAIFSVLNAVLIRALPYQNPEQLTVIWGTQGKDGQQGVVIADYIDWRARNHSFSDIAAMRGQSVNLTGGDTPDRLIGVFVSANIFRVINAKMAQGRAFTDAESELATKAPVAVVQYETWQSKFGADPALVGKTITVNGSIFTVVGITAPNTQLPLMTGQIYLPLAYYPNAKGFDRGVRGIWTVGRLKPGVTIAAAQKDLAAISSQLEKEYPATNTGTGVEVISLRESLVGRVRETLFIMAGAVALVLLIACANVANLQLARGASRMREFSVRAALGAGRGRIAQQLITESVVLSLIGGLLGIGLALGLVKMLATLVGPMTPTNPGDIRLDVPVLLFALAISIGTGLLFGLVPAWQSSRTNLNDALRTRTGGAHSTTRNILAVVQLALSLALLASAGLLTRSLMLLQQVDPGFDAHGLLTAQFRLPAAKYDSPEKIATMFEQTLAQLRAIPGVQSAALVRASPLSQNGDVYPITIADKPALRPADAPQMLVNSVSPGYFSTMHVPVIAGRDVEPSDRLGTPQVMIVNKTFAETNWPGESPIGKRIKFGDENWWTIVGVVGDTKHFTLNEKQLLQGYVPHAQRPQIFTSIVVRTQGEPMQFARPVREAVWKVDRDQPIWRFVSMEQDVSAVVTSKKVMMWLTGSLAIVALLVAAVGIYGVQSYTVSQRIQEVGIRIALGAEASTVTRMVVGEGAKLVGFAVIAGLAASAGAARLLRSQLFGVQPNDLTTFAIVTVILSAVAVAACYFPARRASRVDPMVALRAD